MGMRLDLKYKCVDCGSRFDLTEHHDKEEHLNRHNKKDKHTKILCRTCHYFNDFDKNIKCYSKAIEKLYDERMDAMEKSFVKI